MNLSGIYNGFFAILLYSLFYTVNLQNLKKIVTKLLMLFNALCNASGITQSTVNDIVNGTTYNAGIVTIKKLCDSFGISVRNFFM